MPKKKRQRGNKRKSHKPQRKQNRSNNNKNEPKMNNDCEGDLFLVGHGDGNTRSHFWATLYGPILSLYNLGDKKNVVGVIRLNDYKNISVNKCSFLFEIKKAPSTNNAKASKPTSHCINAKTLCFAFKTNNERHEWLTHIDYIINNLQNEEKQDDDITNNAINSSESIEFLQSALKIYTEWENNKNENESLQICLRKTLNASYLTILNHFHCMIANNEKRSRDKNDIPDQCSSAGDGECKYMKNRSLMGRRTLNDDEKKKDNDQNKLKSDDVLWSQLLDKVHCYLYHSDITESMRGNVSDKFVIETEHDDINNDEMENKREEHGGDAAMFAFGCSFDYYDDKFGNYTNAHYLSLKEELISNPYHKITVNKYYSIYLHALQIMKSTQFKNIKAGEHGMWNSKTGICINERITINHIISLLIYCNETEIQKIYKQHTRKIKNNESYIDVIKRQSFIAHWTRYLSESCLFYGIPLNENEYVYCGIDNKLTFNSMTFDNYCPLSTSTDLNVANNFATNQGLIMKLQRNGIATNCQFFDMMLLSDYPGEKEKFFCGMAKMKFVDIIIDGESNKDKISALRLLELILNGSLFYYEWNQELYDDKIQIIVIKLLNDYMNYSDNTYFNKLASAIIDSFIMSKNDMSILLGQKLLCLNYCEIIKLDISLRRFFVSQRMLFESKRWNTNIKRINNELKIHQSTVHQIKVNGNYLKKWNRLNVGIGSIEIGNCVVGGYKFNFLVRKFKKQHQDYFNVVFVLNNKNYFNALKISWDMVCKEVNYQHLQKVFKFGRMTGFRANCDTFLCSKTKKMETLSLDFNIRIIGLLPF